MTTTFPTDATLFFCIGAQKAGTTWLYDFLQQSPDCHFCRNKELHYFDVMLAKGERGHLTARLDILRKLSADLVPKTGAYNETRLQLIREMTDLLQIYTGTPEDHGPYLRYLLEGRTNEPVVCDITPSYAVLDSDALQQMAALGRSRFLFIMRDPIDRMWSQIRMAVSFRREDPDLFEEHCIDHAKSLFLLNRFPKIQRADYRKTLQNMEEALTAEQSKIMFYETLFSQQSAEDICAFLGIAPIPAQGDQVSNKGQPMPIPEDIEAEFFRALEPQYDYVLERFGAHVPDAWRDRYRRLSG